ncbi:MAG TPA: tol-pal system protein YbgF [Gammaproteobacteria bacterium]|nr:tol-pal system protein YbgF [Gammaproteobacteria bacterium]
MITMRRPGPSIVVSKSSTEVTMSMPVRHRGLLLTVLLAFVAGSMVPAAAEERLPDRRAVGTSARTTSSSTQRDNLLDLLQQLEALQAEVRQLRNTTEVQGHELEQLKNRQRSLYDDLDKRLRETERHASTPAAAATGGAGIASVPPTSSAADGPRTVTAAQQQEYDAAFGLMKQGLYEKAIKAFRSFLVKYPDSGLADNAQYWIAEGNYVLRNYKLALEEFTKVLSYNKSVKTPDAMLKIGYVHYELGAYDKARQALTEVQQRYPGTPVARLAGTRLEKMKKEGH